MSDRDVTSDRRSYLKYAGTAVIAGLAGCSAGNGGGNGDETTTTTTESDDGGSDEPNHEAPHPDDATLSDAEATGTSLSGGERQVEGGQQEKDNPNVMLQHTPSGERFCGNCSLYVPDQNDDGFGACISVAGKIHPCDFCNLYTEFEGEPVECGQV